MAPLGVGTEQIEEELKARFRLPEVARMDRDTMGAGAYIDLVRDLHEGKVDILVGTRMVAKGHHFPRVSLVGVVLAETSLMVPDFRATERTFHLLMQVAGRAGRGEVPGEAIVRPLCPGHPILAFVQEHDFAGFAETELSARREVRYPPFVRLVRVLITGTDEVRVSAAAAGARPPCGRRAGKEIEVLGPAPAPLARLKESSAGTFSSRARARPVEGPGSARIAGDSTGSGRFVALCSDRCRSRGAHVRGLMNGVVMEKTLICGILLASLFQREGCLSSETRGRGLLLHCVAQGGAR